MPCKACGKNESLEVCLGCGHSFCGMHRTDRGGTPACTPCVKEEAERARRRQQKPPAGELAGSTTPVSVAPEVSAPLPEPKSALKPFLFGLAVAAPVAAYLYWLGGQLIVEHELPAWTQMTLTALGSAFAFAGIWAIVKTKG